MTPPETFRAAVFSLCDRYYPQHKGGKIRLRIPGGAAVSVSFPASVGLPQHAVLTAMQEAILEALAKHVGDPLTGDDLAKLAGYEPGGGAWKRALAELLAMGRVENCRPGYRLIG